MFEALIAAFVSLLVAWFLSDKVNKEESGSHKMEEIAKAIKEGAVAYLARQNKTIAIFALVIAGILYALLGWKIAASFIVGAFFSALSGYIGMMVSVSANVKTAQAAKKGLDNALSVAIKGGAVTGLAVVGLALGGVALFYILFKSPSDMLGFAFGASLVSLFARVGGGIFTKAADVGADLVGKIEAGIPEDDPRNPAVIADNVGDNVGDCAGMGADLFETYAVSLIGAMLLGQIFYASNPGYITYPLMLGAVAVFASIIGIPFIRVGKKGSIMAALYKGLLATVIVAAILFYYLTQYTIGNMSVFYSAMVGLAITAVLFASTEFYTSAKFSHVKEISESSKTGPATTIIAGLASGMKSTAVPLLAICAGIIITFSIAGLYGIAIAVMAMLSLTGMIITMDAYGPITDNAGGIAEMSGLEKHVRDVTDALDAVGNTTKAVTKAFAIGSAALASLTLFAAYVGEIEKLGASSQFLINDPVVLVGLFVGGLVPFYFSSFCLRAVGNGAFKVVEEVRRQFKHKGIMEGTQRPDYAKCVDIVTVAALNEMKIPSLIAVLTPLAIGFLLGPKAVGGLLMGSIVSGFLLAILMTNGGAAWDNAKKYIESGKLGGKGSDAHKAAVVGDTIGDPFKDTAGPALNPLIKVMNTIALLAAGYIIKYALLAL